MTYRLFKDLWSADRHTEAQMQLTWGFLRLLDDCVTKAYKEAESLRLDGNDAKAAQFMRGMEGFSRGTRTREYKAAIRIFKAASGAAIEERAYQLLDANDALWVEDYTKWDDFNFATELQLADAGSGFPHSFKGRGASKGSRPDVRFALGGGYEALFDITADSSASQGHLLGKGANGWLARCNVPIIAEVYYPGGVSVASIVKETSMSACMVSYFCEVGPRLGLPEQYAADAADSEAMGARCATFKANERFKGIPHHPLADLNAFFTRNDPWGAGISFMYEKRPDAVEAAGSIATYRDLMCW
ncbi:hypothetical protein [Massilia sp. S19_KUP03_FR1]|uniref:hypothetical protein n=1 Tax=Massilia sp. S19_KUP03_FR1 TaxID=3025503 RepID=UPI002FCD9335